MSNSHTKHTQIQIATITVTMAAECHCVTRYLNCFVFVFKGSSTASIQIAIFSSIYLTLTNTHILTRESLSLTLWLMCIVYAFIVKFGTFWQFGECIEVRNDELFIVTAFSQILIAIAMKYLYCCLALIINTIRIETKDAIRNIHF